MPAVNELISLLNKTELQGFVQYLSNRNKRKDTKNVDLFNALLNGKELTIKNSIGSNAYNALHKRLSDRLLDYMAGLALDAEATKEITIIKQLLIARKLFTHNKSKLAFNILGKAEKEAILISHYSLLSEIYQTYIQYSFLDLAPDQESLFNRYEENKNLLAEQEKLNMAYALIRKAFNSIEYQSESIDLKELVKDTYNRFGISDQHGYNFQSLYQLAQIADISGAYGKDYHSIDLFFVDKVKELENGVGDTEKFLVYHIDVLYLIANIYFRKRMFEESRVYLDKMYTQMQRFNQQYFNEKLVQYSTLLALNLNFAGKFNESKELLESLTDSKKYHFEELLNPYLVLTMIHFQQGELNKAKKLLSKFNRTDSWYERQIGLEWTLNKKYIEILLHIELGNVDYVDSRILGLTRKHGDLFKAKKESQVLPFLKLVKEYYQTPEVVTTEKFKAKVEKSITWKPKEQEDIFLICFYAWLKGKMENEPVYDVTLRIVSN